MLFLWVFLPIVLLLGMIFREPTKQNICLLLASLLFYAWGEPVYILLLLFSILMNWGLGLIMGSISEHSASRRKAVLIINILLNLGLLGYYKYAYFIMHTIDRFLPNISLDAPNVELPIGISFFTFQAMSYVIDLYRGEYAPQKDPLKLALYISFFPQLIAGPIVRYIDVERQLRERTITLDKIASGFRRFLYGLAKKVLLANVLADAVDLLLKYDPSSLSIGGSWVIAIFDTLQIYYDFSGYSDMAIGLGRIFGFEFLENFRYPYLSGSIGEFWRRWHISLGTWFREYLYIPLGGNRKGTFRTYLNLFVVFAVTGLWHGASWRFVFWGLFHGFFSILERLGLSKFLNKHPIIAHLYTLLTVVLGWVIFRADSLGDALTLWCNMFGIRTAAATIRLGAYIGPHHILACILGILGCGPIQILAQSRQCQNIRNHFVGKVPEAVFCGLMLFVCIVRLAGSTYNPFIYFRF